MSIEEDDDDVWLDDEDTPSPQEPEDSPPPETTPEPEPDPPISDPDDLERLKQKVRSAEGRYQKFGENIDQMRSELEALQQQQQQQPADADTAPLLPDGWTERDWEDFVADSPVEAELLQAQNQKLATLQQRLDESQREQSQRELLQQFRATVLQAHPDYESLMQDEGEQVRAFIAGQENSLVKSAYERVYQQGTADEVVELVNQYKLSRGSLHQQQQQRINASLAVPGRAPVPDAHSHGGLPPEDDEDAAWDYFSDESI